MKKTYNKKGDHDGYEIGHDIEIHGHINDPDSWHLTIRKLQIFGERLCDRDCTDQAIARYVNVRLSKNLLVINDLIKTVAPFTAPPAKDV